MICHKIAPIRSKEHNLVYLNLNSEASIFGIYLYNYRTNIISTYYIWRTDREKSQIIYCPIGFSFVDVFIRSARAVYDNA